MRCGTCYYHTNHLGINDLIFRVSIWKYDGKPDQEEQKSSSLCHVERSIKWQEKLPLPSGTPTMHEEDECGATLGEYIISFYNPCKNYMCVS